MAGHPQRLGRPGPKGEVKIVELVAATPDAYTALWRFLLGVDLTRDVVKGPASPDEPSATSSSEPAPAGRQDRDGLWLRIVDLPAALAARRYAAPVDVVLDVTDALLPANAGRWRLRVGAGGALVNCSPTDAPADLSCDVASWARRTWAARSSARSPRPAASRSTAPAPWPRASTAFGWHVTPASIEIF